LINKEKSIFIHFMDFFIGRDVEKSFW